MNEQSARGEEMINLELMCEVAKLLGWTCIEIEKDHKGEYLIGYPKVGPDWMQEPIPSYVTNLNACIDGIREDERVRSIVIDTDPDTPNIDLWNTWDGSAIERIHDGTSIDIAEKICNAFVELCENARKKGSTE